jgi:cytoskeletal protein CcmA (bactofilin family)
MAFFGNKETQQPARPVPRGDASATVSSGASLLGASITCEGTITGDENLVIEGKLKGRVDLRSDLRIAAAAIVEADVHARNVIVEGTLVGDLSADNRVELIKGCRVDGNIRAPKIVVAEGAVFRGAVQMGSSPATEQRRDTSREATETEEKE